MAKSRRFPLKRDYKIIITSFDKYIGLFYFELDFFIKSAYKPISVESIFLPLSVEQAHCQF